MTQEQKHELLVALCGYLPYKVICSCIDNNFTPESIDYELVSVNLQDETVIVSNDVWNNDFHIEYIKPYLRPMSSMTEEEKEELKGKCLHTETEEDWEGTRSDVWGIEILSKYDTRRWDNTIWASTINMDAIDWLNAHHFDYRGLIKKGFALEALEGMYDTKNDDCNLFFADEKELKAN